jgi:hypothetical protein
VITTAKIRKCISRIAESYTTLRWWRSRTAHSAGLGRMVANPEITPLLG